MQKTVNFKKKIIASAIASAIGFSGAAFAQDDAEEIVVTGIKASLTRAMDIKRDAKGVVDAISAEDIGKMPDANLAESLQRISGVSIDRSGGEGSKVTVRGLAGDYNLVTLNGRQMPASTSGGNNASYSRSFDFANLASEGISGVEVYKTGRADVASGGMGALINIVTPHPLARPGFHASVGAKAVYDQSSHDSNVTPEISGLYSNTFNDDTIGVAFTGSYQERKYGSAEAFTGGWFNGTGPDTGSWGSIAQGWAGNASQIPAGVTGNQVFSNPINFGYRITDSKRERTNGNLIVEFKPVDNLTLAVDGLYVRQDVDYEAHSMSTWFNRSGGTVKIDWTKNSTGSIAPLRYEETNPNPLDLAIDAQLTGTRNELNSVGFNVKYDANDKLSFVVDAHHSESVSKPNSIYGTGNSLTAQAQVNYNPSVDFSGDIPVLHLNYPAGVTTAPTPAQMQLTGSTFRNTKQDSEVDQFQLKSVYTVDDSLIKKINLGLARADISNRTQYVVSDLQNHGSWAGVGKNPAGDLPASLWPIDNLTNYFSDLSSGGGLQNAFTKFDLDKVAKAAGAITYNPVTGLGYGSATVNANSPCANLYCAPTIYANMAGLADGAGGQSATDLLVDEVTLSGYVQAELEADVSGHTMHALVGVREEQTSVTSTSLIPVLGAGTWITNNEFALATTSAGSFFRETGEYSQVLPSLDYDVGLTDSIKLRASVSTTMARTSYDNLRGTHYAVGNVRVGGTQALGDASVGDPNLKPLLSKNKDLSVEWYYDDASYVSLGYFSKNLVDFIGSATRTEVTANQTVIGGQRFLDAINATGSSDVGIIRSWIIANTDQSLIGGLNHDQIKPAANDPTVLATVTYPINNKDAKVTGWELAVQHTFGESGFGLMANATKVDSDDDSKFKDNSLDAQFAVLGLSDSANLVAFYDKNGIQARIAYNWRDKYLSYIDGNQAQNPVYVRAYGQVDASVSYEIIENLTLGLEGSNITNEKTRTFGRNVHELFNYAETGARYDLSVRYKF